VSKSVKGTRTEQNLLTAFAGEAQARNRYDYASSVAKKEGYVQISHVFAETAGHEKEHAKRLFKFLEGGEVEITHAYPAGIIGTTLENLESAAAGEKYEYSEMYPEFAAIAKEEGFKDIAYVFDRIAKAEMYHEERYRAFIRNIEENKVFVKPEPVVWRCRNCGYNHEGLEAPERCPACDHPQAHFEIKATNW
jgi:rubrerythrin